MSIEHHDTNLYKTKLVQFRHFNVPARVQILADEEFNSLVAGTMLLKKCSFWNSFNQTL